jgi:hypothetical protein
MIARQLDEAIPLFDQTLADREPVLGQAHPDTLTSRDNLANAYRMPGGWTRLRAYGAELRLNRDALLISRLVD